jgi:type I restriction enzyme S subunit
VIADLQPYPAYKPSGVPWLGAVPQYWDASKVKSLARPGYKTFVDGDWIESPFIASEGIRLIQTGNIGVGAYREKGFRYIGETTFDAFGCTEFQPNDVLICRLGEPVGRACLAPDLGVRMITSVDVCILKPRDDVVPAFVVYAMSSPRYLNWVNSLVRGSTRDRVSRSMLGNFVVPLPPLLEQAAIVRFLDHVDRRIRRYIRAKQKLIKLLEEQKQAIIHRAVTRGLPSTGSGQATPNVPACAAESSGAAGRRLKPSGVEWLGDVPEHWEVAALRHRYSQCLGKMLDSKRITGSHSLSYLRNTDVQWDRVNIEDLPAMDIPSPEYDRYTVQQGDLLVCEGGDVGRCAIWSGELSVCGFQKALHRLRPLNAARDVPRFMYYALRAAAKGNAFNDGHLSTIAHLTGDKLRAHRFPFPPVAEQEALVSFLDAALKQVDQAISTAYREISLLREYRTRLIADVVTGKLDVREAAARLPEEAEEPEPPDKADILSDAEEEPADERDAVPEEAEG